MTPRGHQQCGVPTLVPVTLVRQKKFYYYWEYGLKLPETCTDAPNLLLGDSVQVLGSICGQWKRIYEH
jgi:hypothetical protein